MAANKFKFVSPGVFINEIDQSQIARQPEDIGPVVVGRSLKGPMMRPVKVSTYTDFEALFGSPIPGSSNSDVWREGNKLAPTYGAYAAEAYLTNAGPLTFVRLGGVASGEAVTGGEAGWSVKAPHASIIANNGGAYGLFVAPISGSGTATPKVSGSARLASIIYVDGGALSLVGEHISGSSVVSGSALWIKSSDNTTKQFKLKVSGSGGEVAKNVNFSKESKLFVRNVLNTNPTKTNSAITTADGLENYWLGESYETELNAELGDAGSYAGIILALASGSVSAGNFKKDMEVAKTGWIFSQHLNDAATWDITSGEPTGVKNLFCFHALAEDEWSQKNVKVSIQDIKLPVSAYTDYGTFSVVVRDIDDTDDQPRILERFDQCNLDPSSPDYVGKKIGDIYADWNEIDKKFDEYGQYENKSRFVRIQVDPEIDGNGGAGLLPFGFYGPLKYKDSPVLTGASGSAIAVDGFAGSMLTTEFVNAEDQTGMKANAPVTASFKFPVLPTVTSNDKADHYVRNASSLYWGMKTSLDSSKKFNKSLVEYTRTAPVSITANNTEYSFIFSLDEISGSVDYKNVAWVPGSRTAEGSYTSQGDAEDLSAFLAKVNKFTLPLVGGFEGLDVKEKEPFGNHVLSDNDETQSYAVNSIIRAIEGVADPEVVEMNALVVPGAAKPRIHNKMIDVCENRGDSLAILDLEGDYTPVTQTEPDTNPTGIKPSVANAVSYVKGTLAPNTSYGCTFFPWVMTVDNRDGNKVWIPSSIVALGTFGSTQRFSEVWFAPAGFTRGGLSANNAGGLPVVQTSLKLNSKDRDTLYETNINPIATFPAEGIVIFGQKTLQSTPSALDRVNVRRMMNYVKKEVSRIASTVLFDQNVKVTWARFIDEVEPFLAEVKSGLGLTDFKVVLDETTTTPELIDRNILYAKIFLKPARAIEYIALDFTITNSGASFAD
jgi:hypothetical protein